MDDGSLLIGIVAAAALLLIPLASWSINAANRAVSAELDGGRSGAALARHLDRTYAERNAGAAGMREAEIRQMLEAQSYVRQRRGEAALDIEAELARIRPGGRA